MCGRYSITTPTEALRQLMGFLDLLNLEPRYNLAPTQLAPVVRLEADGKARRLVLLRWGLIPSWAKDAKIGAQCINARSDGVAEKPAFRSAVRRRRCLVPADGWYEWKAAGKTKQAYRIVLAAGGPFAFAGIWESWRSPEGASVESFAVITTDASPDIAPIHHRQPVVLEPDQYALWLEPGEARLEDQLALLKPSRPGLLSGYAISSRVNHVKNDDADLIKPAEPVSPTLF
jgi:putative SOS response-associated peptidase YedK